MVLQVHYFDEYGSHYIQDTFDPFHHIYIIGNGAIGGSEMLWNSCEHIMEYDFIPKAWYGTSTLF